MADRATLNNEQHTTGEESPDHAKRERSKGRNKMVILPVLEMEHRKVKGIYIGR